MPSSAEVRVVRPILCVLLACALLAGATACTRPSQYNQADTKQFDENTTYRITDVDKGFKVLVNYEEYQFWPRRGRSHQGCRDRLIWIAAVYAKEKNRVMAKIDDRLIHVDSGRNILSGYTTCTATYTVDWVYEKT